MTNIWGICHMLRMHRYTFSMLTISEHESTVRKYLPYHKYRLFRMHNKHQQSMREKARKHVVAASEKENPCCLIFRSLFCPPLKAFGSFGTLVPFSQIYWFFNCSSGLGHNYFKIVHLLSYFQDRPGFGQNCHGNTMSFKLTKTFWSTYS